MRLFKVFGYGLVLTFIGLGIDCFPIAANVPALINRYNIYEGIENDENDILAIAPPYLEPEDENIPKSENEILPAASTVLESEDTEEEDIPENEKEILPAASTVLESEDTEEEDIQENEKETLPASSTSLESEDEDIHQENENNILPEVPTASQSEGEDTPDLENDILPAAPTSLESEGETIPNLWLKLTGTEIRARNNIVSFSVFNYQITALIPGVEGDVSSEDENANKDAKESDELFPSLSDSLTKRNLPLLMNMKLIDIEVGGDLLDTSTEEQD